MLILLLMTLYLYPNRGNPTQCMLPNGTYAPCGPGNDQCGQPFNKSAPQFHVMDRSCGINDPNGPIYDIENKIYHLFYQDHLGEPGGKVTWGHVVSRDLVHWAHLPVAIWNDSPFDQIAIYSGSSTIVDNRIVIIYPGLCKTSVWPSCTTGFNLVMAVPEASRTDPLLTNWTKLGVIVNASNKDPSSAWETPSGEWRLVTGDTPMIYGSMDFSTWYEIGVQPGFDGGDCPSFFPLPPPTPTSNPIAYVPNTPTHVHMVGGGWMTLGQYTAGPPKSNGTWIKADTQTHRKADKGVYYATKDFWDPVKKRRLLWGWAVNVPPASAQTMAREITWNSELQQLVFSPIEEQIQLRGKILANLTTTKINANETLSLGNWGESVGNQSEVYVTFEIPNYIATFGVVVMTGSDGGKASGTYFYVDYSPESNEVNINDSIDEPPKYHTITVGAMQNRTGSVRKTTDTLRLSPNDKTISMHIFVDNTFSEAYWQNGRVAMTVTTPATDEAGMAISSDASIILKHAHVWRVNNIWISPEQLITNITVPYS